MGPIRYDLIEESRYNEILDYLKNHFHDEPLNMAVRLFEKGETCERLEEYDLNTMKDGLSYVAIDSESGRIAGTILNGISHRGDVEEELEKMKSIDDIKFNRLMGLLFTNNADVELFKKYNVDKIFELRILSVDNDFRGKGLAQKLMEMSEQLAQEQGFTLLKVDATSFFTQKICTKLGYKAMKSIVYKDLKNENGEFIYDVPSPHDTYKIMVKDISRGPKKVLLSVHCKLSEAKSEVGPFQYELIPESRFRDIVTFLRNHFHDEPLNVALGVFKKGETCERLKEYEMKTLKYGVSYMAIDTKSGKIAGASLNGISHKGEAEQELEKMKFSDDIKYNRLMGLIYSNNVEVELFKKYNVDELFDLRILTVDHHYRGKGLAQKLLEVSEQLAIEKGYTLLKVDATSFFTQKICTKLGFETIRTVPYKEIKDEHNKFSYTTAPPHEAYKIMVKYISRDKKSLDT